MTRDSLLNRDWEGVVERLGGTEALEAGARETKAFQRPRAVKCAVDMLRLVLAYCLGAGGLRSVAAWAAAVGLADLSNVGLLYRLRKSSDWLALLISQMLAAAAPKPAQGRLIRLVDATVVAKAGRAAKQQNAIWRVHSAFELPSERFGFFELTDQKGGERLDRLPVIKGEIRIGDRAYMQPDRVATIVAGGGDVVVRSGWRNARWLEKAGEPVNLLAEFRKASEGLVDRPIWVGRKNGPPLALRLIALRKSPDAAAVARRKARQQARKEGYQLSQEALEAADWLIVVTSLKAEEFSTTDVLDLYRLRWRIELGFKRLKSLVGLEGPPGKDEASARAYILAHLLVLLLLEPLVDAFEDSPHWAEAA
jgi:IS4 transposase